MSFKCEINEFNISARKAIPNSQISDLGRVQHLLKCLSECVILRKYG